MKSIVIYYSFKGHTKTEAEKIALGINAEIIEIKEVKKRGMFSAFLSGCPAALKQKGSPIVVPEADLTVYERFIVCAPVWAGYAAPAFNSILEILPKGSEVEIVLCSGGGESRKGLAGATKKAEDLGLKVISSKEIKTAV